MNEAAQLRRADEQLMQGEASLIAAAIAAIAAGPPHELRLALEFIVPARDDLVGRLVQAGAVFLRQLAQCSAFKLHVLSAVRAYTPREALCKHAQKRVAETERIQAHVEQARNALRRAVGVQRGKHQMSGERSFDRDPGGLFV